MAQTEVEKKTQIVDSHLVSIRCKYYGPTNTLGSRISVSRWDSPTWGKDPNRITVQWDHALNPNENYVNAVHDYVVKAGWGGQWSVARVPDGAVAVWSGEVA